VSPAGANQPPDSPLLFRDASRWRPLPAWARGLVQLGSSLARLDEIGRGALLVVTLPARPWAALLVASGVAHRRLQVATAAGRTDSLTSLEGLSPGDPVTVFRNNKRFPGSVVAIEPSHELPITVQVKGGEIWRYAAAEAWRIKPQGGRDQQHPAHSAMTPAVRRPQFLTGVYGIEGLLTLSRGTTASFLIAGRRSVLFSEARPPSLGSRTREGRIAVGSFSTLVRPLSLLGQQQSAICDIVAAPAVSKNRTGAVEGTSLVIFDGARAWLTRRHEWPDANWCVLLSAADQATTDAVIAIEQLYRTRYASDLPSDASPMHVPGTTLAGFCRAV
jgi:hypothetical protein